MFHGHFTFGAIWSFELPKINLKRAKIFCDLYNKYDVINSVSIILIILLIFMLVLFYLFLDYFLEFRPYCNHTLHLHTLSMVK